MSDHSLDESNLSSRKQTLLRRRHWEVLTISIVCLLVLCVLKTDSQRVSVFGYQLPELCGARAWFGLSCPGCGLTRSLTALVRGDVAAAWHYHHLGWLMFLLIAGQIPYRLWALNTPTQGADLRWPKVVGYTVMAALLANWLLDSLQGVLS